MTTTDLSTVPERPHHELPVGIEDIRDAARALEGVATVTPVERSSALAGIVGAPVYLKCENLQRSGSFKIRGAYVRMSRLDADERARGVVAASAGNHAQGVALAARLLGIRAVVYMPTDAALPKVAATREYGAEVRLVGTTVDDVLTAAREESERSGAVLIHPFDHVDVVAGQATVALEILEQVPDVKTIVVPVGGGGLGAGVVAAMAAVAPHVRVVGVQAARAGGYLQSLAAGEPVKTVTASTMADGIAVSTPGAVPFQIIKDGGGHIRTVSEEDISRALLFVAERAKLIVEPAGVAGVAALMAHPEEYEGPVVAVLSGGNIDPLVLLRVLRHGLAAAGRYMQLRVRLVDRPGALADLLQDLARSGGNIMHVDHVRTGVDLAIDEVEVTMQVETKGPEHCAALLDHLRGEGYRLSE
ncbi:threonine ammonia-lyase [Sanguibacter sp. 4.1]|uniref:L-threonine dehydratase catabolic TdcB n=1 Tax=Sanguibacter biliveldensis TaxID=3030830 RepID=A0AAF0Z9M3_9MICO|nr:threonine ammonia-lyase [Sanguibacter sp. 4.1]WPF83151.1 threonine ammonia-lyase [Sanguibacter sp. 4.1]